MCQDEQVGVELVQSDAGRLFVQLVDSFPQMMGSLKGLDGKYRYVNSGFSQRVGLDASSIVGSTVHDLFVAELADSYQKQDESVLKTGQALTSHLELIVRADASLGWYVTSKAVVRHNGDVIGVSALSIDLDSQLQSGHAGLAAAITAIKSDIHLPWRVSEMAEIAHLSSVQLERRCRTTLGLSPRKLLQRLRLEHSVHLITTTDRSIGDISADCGFYDQSSFTRQFKSVLGLTPGAYRSMR